MAQTLIDFDSHLADPHIGFELGWDHAHHGLVPPPAHLHAHDPVCQGWRAGQACFGERTLSASRLVRQWLRLRLHAWLRGRAFDLNQVTPHYLGQLDVPLCPVLRTPLVGAEASIDRVCDQAGYAAGNLAMMSLQANRAKAALGWEAALANAKAALAEPDGRHGGLDAAAWSRVAVLASFVTPLAHAQAACLPLLLQPPNRLRLLNPVQGLQALVTRELAGRDGMLRLRSLAALLPREALRIDFHRFVSALLPRLIEVRQQGDAMVLRQALGDAWTDARVNRSWQRFALQLDESYIDRLLQQFAVVARTHTMLHARASATEGWALDTAGRAPVPAEAEGRLRAWHLAHGTRELPIQAKMAASRSRTPDGHLPA